MFAKKELSVYIYNIYREKEYSQKKSINKFV